MWTFGCLVEPSVLEQWTICECTHLSVQNLGDLLWMDATMQQPWFHLDASSSRAAAMAARNSSGFRCIQHARIGQRNDVRARLAPRAAQTPQRGSMKAAPDSMADFRRHGTVGDLAHSSLQAYKPQRTSGKQPHSHHVASREREAASWSHWALVCAGFATRR